MRLQSGLGYGVSDPEPAGRKQGVVSRVATGLFDPVMVRAMDLRDPIPTKVSDHARERWHARVMRDRTLLRSTVAMVEMLEAGLAVRSRRHAFSWVKARDRNLIYFAIGSDLLLPAELSSEPGFELEIVTCLTNPAVADPLAGSGWRRNRETGAARRLQRSGRLPRRQVAYLH